MHITFKKRTYIIYLNEVWANPLNLNYVSFELMVKLRDCIVLQNFIVPKSIDDLWV